MKYRREIDGLRTVAVLPVILFHAGFSSFGGGYVGVDVFFVISGYLITTIILAEKEKGSFTILSFYERRARRILPALFVVMLACLPFAWLWMSPFELKSFSRSIVAVSTFASNILFWHESGYFGAAAELKPLLHTWSLAVEEQYYVLFPLFVIWTWRLGTRRMLAILGVVSIASFALMQWLVFRSQDTAFFLLPTRAWELLLGAFAAFHLRNLSVHEGVLSPWRQPLSLLGLALILASIFLYDHDTPFPSAYALAPTVGTLLIILFAAPATLVGRLLGSKPFVAIGLVSYSAYLWHQPLFAFARLRSSDLPSPELMLALSLASLALAWLSWKYVEAPFRTRQVFDRKQIFAMAGAASALMLGLGLAGNFSQGFFNESYRARLEPAEQVLWDQIYQSQTRRMDLTMPDDGDCNFWSDKLDANFEQRFDQCTAKHGQAVIALGDSHGMNLYSLLQRNHFAKFLVGISKGGCRPPMGAPQCAYDDFTEFLSTRRQAVSLIIYNQSGQYLMGEDDSSRYGDYRAWDPPIPPLSPNLNNFAKTLQYLEGLQHENLVWLGPWVDPAVDLRTVRGVRERARVLDVMDKNFLDLEQALVAYTQKHARKTKYASSISMLAYDPKQYVLLGDCLTFRDDDHFSECGELVLGSRIAAGLERHRPARAH